MTRRDKLMGRLVAIGDSDGYESFPDIHLVMLTDKTTEALIAEFKEYKSALRERATYVTVRGKKQLRALMQHNKIMRKGWRRFDRWLIENGYAREANSDEVEIIEEPSSF